MEQALNGTKTMYAVLNAPVTGGPADDAFGIPTDEYFYIQYAGEIIKSSTYYQDGLGAQTTYAWEQTNDVRESMSRDTFLYDDIPIDLTSCIVTAPDGLSSDEQVSLPENTKAFVNADSNYYYPEGMKGDPDDLELNCGMTRFRIFFLRSGTSLSFLAMIGDNEISVYSSALEDGSYAPATVVQNGSLSDLSWVMEQGPVGDIILVWIFAAFVIISIILATAFTENDEEEAPPSEKKKVQKKKKLQNEEKAQISRRGHKNNARRRRNTYDKDSFCLSRKYLPKHNGSECASIYGEQCGTCRKL